MKFFPFLAAAVFTAALASAQEAPKETKETKEVPEEKKEVSKDLPSEPEKPALRSEPTLRLANPPAAPDGQTERNDPIGLIPELSEPAPKPRGGAIPMPPSGSDLSGADGRGPRVDKTTAAQDELKARIRLRELTNKISSDPKMIAELDSANNAATDLEKREGLKSYYTNLYGRVIKADRSLEKRANELKMRLIHRLAQTRVDPTEPIDPQDRPASRSEE